GWDWPLIVSLRMPRVAAAAGVGSLLALAGLGLQVLLRNPLADPYVLGHSGGASVGALAALLLGAALWAGAAVGALAAGLALLWLARPALMNADDASPRLILLGAMLASISGAIATLLLALVPDERLRGALFWIVGDLSGAHASLWNLAAAAAFVALLWVRGRSVDRMMLGADAAWLLGEPVRRLRLELLAAASIAVGLAVSTAGAIGFVGLVVAQGWRLAGVLRTRELAILSAFSGAALLMTADSLARTIASPLELPVGAVMALVGAPCFIWFLAKGVR
ncbi:MAG: iron ABC transporter permease, partial [Burkholderiaceae bacterium]